MLTRVCIYSHNLNSSDLINSLGQKEKRLASCMYMFHSLHFILFHSIFHSRFYNMPSRHGTFMYHTCGWPKYSHHSNRNSSSTTDLAVSNSRMQLLLLYLYCILDLPYIFGFNMVFIIML